jgi:preprotein translocase subunit YajC
MISFAHAADAVAPAVGSAAPAAQQGSLLGSLMPLVFLFAIFYFIVIRPQQKQQRAHKAMLLELKKGDKVVTSGGFIVDIEKVEADFYAVKMNKDTTVKIAKESVTKLYEPVVTEEK